MDLSCTKNSNGEFHSTTTTLEVAFSGRISSGNSALKPTKSSVVIGGICGLFLLLSGDLLRNHKIVIELKFNFMEKKTKQMKECLMKECLRKAIESGEQDERMKTITNLDVSVL